MKIEVNDILDLENNEKYKVIHKVDKNNNTYLLLNNVDNSSLALVKAIDEGGKISLNKLEEDEYNEIVLELDKMEIK